MQDKRICESIRILAVIVLLFALIMTILSGKIPVQAAGAQVSVSSATAEKGDTVKVNVSLSGNPGLWAIKVKVAYDSSALQIKSMSNGGVFPGSEAICNESKGVYVATASGFDDVTGNGTLFTVEFKVLDGASASAYNVSASIEQAKNASGGNVSVSSGSGAVTVEECIHSKSWVVTKAATCESAGEQQNKCSKCGEVFETKAIAVTGHQHTEVRNQVAATSTKEGYTGDTYCTDCGKKIATGKTIAKTTVKTDTTKTETNKKDTNSTSTAKTDTKSSDSKSTDTKTETKSTTKTDTKSTDKKSDIDDTKASDAASETVSEAATEEVTSEADTEQIADTEIETESETTADTETKETVKDTADKSDTARKAVAVVIIVVGIAAIGALIYYFIIRRRPGRR